ncbi:MAG: potassium transporter TrkG [Desulfobacca sp.]|nr:potassium transporter TrkG [Desulfobacca sp.]
MFDNSLKKKLFGLLKSPQMLLVGGFAGVILLGSLLLSLPWAHQSGPLRYLDALFTSTSAVCVTGLIVVDTGTAYTLFGQIVILMLIQTGGLGVMTFAALIFQMLGRRLSLQSQAVLHDSFFQRDLGSDFKRIFGHILLTTITIEALGALLIFLALWGRTEDLGGSFYSSIFHSVSAFCNAGFSIYKNSLIEVRDSELVIITIMLLIITGGLGYGVLLELWRSCRYGLGWGARQGSGHLLSVHARVVLWTSSVLIVAGTLGLLVLGLTAEVHSWSEKILDALFQSVTARTAGFNTIQIGWLPFGSLFLIAMLMFIGGSPGSCAGGIKTTSFAIWLAEFRARLRGEAEVRILDRRLPWEILWRNTLLIRLAVVWNLMGILILLATEGLQPGVGMQEVVFEQISAFGTVGLSTGLTEKLSDFGRLWIIATMFVGRVGPLTLAIWILPEKHVPVRYPVGKVMIG